MAAAAQGLHRAHDMVDGEGQHRFIEKRVVLA